MYRTFSYRSIDVSIKISMDRVVVHAMKAIHVKPYIYNTCIHTCMHPLNFRPYETHHVMKRELAIYWTMWHHIFDRDLATASFESCFFSRTKIHRALEWMEFADTCETRMQSHQQYQLYAYSAVAAVAVYHACCTGLRRRIEYPKSHYDVRKRSWVSIDEWREAGFLRHVPATFGISTDI